MERATARKDRAAPPNLCRAARFAVYLILCAVLVLNTAAFGGVAAGAEAWTRALLLLALLFETVPMLADPEYGRALGRGAAVPLSAFGALVAYAFVQQYGGMAALEAGRPGTAAAHSTHEAALQLAYYFVFFYLSLNTFSRREYLERALTLFGVLAVAVTLFGWTQKLSGTDKIYWIYEQQGRKFFGPFLYENNFGALMALLLPMNAALAAYRLRRARREAAGEEGAFRWMSRAFDNGAVFFFLAAVLGLAGTFFSQSRSCAVILTGAFAFALIAAAILRRSALVSAVFVAVVLVFGVIAFASNLGTVAEAYGISTISLSAQFRLRIYAETLRMFADRPAFGWGLGSFWSANTPYVSAANEFRAFRHPNNDYVELLAEAGIAGAVIVAAGLAAALAAAAARTAASKSVFCRLAALQALLSLSTLGLMCVFDSHLKVPSIAFFFLFQVAVLLQACSHQKPGLRSALGRLGRPAAVAAAAAGIFLLFQPTVRASEASRLAAARGIDNLLRASELQPLNDAFYYRLAKAYYREALKTSAGAAGRDGLLEASASNAREAIRLCPTYAHYWYTAGQIDFLRGRETEGISSLRRAIGLSPQNRKYAAALLSALLRQHGAAYSVSRKRKIWEEAETVFADIQSRFGDTVWPKGAFLRNDSTLVARLAAGLETKRRR